MMIAVVINTELMHCAASFLIENFCFLVNSSRVRLPNMPGKNFTYARVLGDALHAQVLL